MTFLEQVCHHEAAHAVAAWRHGSILTSLTADGQHNELKHKHVGNWGHDPEKVQELILIQLCGPCAEMKAGGNFFNPSLYEDEVKDLLWRLGIEDRYTLPQGWDEADFWAEYSAPARLEVEMNWQLIQALASELHKRIKMRGVAVAKFLQDRVGLPKGAKPWEEHGD